MSKPLPPPKSSVINLDDKTKKEDELGTLIVVLLKARNLNDKHSFRKSDVFAQATLNGAQKRTHVDIKGGQRPEWDGEVRFTVMKNNAAKHRKLEVACYSQEPRSEDLMGKAIVDIGETLRTGEFDDWVPLEVDGVARGDIYLEMTYYANAPAPVASNKLLTSVSNQNGGLSRRPSKLAPSERLSRPQPQQQVARPQSQNPSNQAYAQSQGYAPKTQIANPSHNQSSVPCRPSRLNEHHSLPIREDSQSTVMPGSYPTGPIQSSPQRKHSDLSTTPEQRSSDLPSILRPGPGSGTIPTAIPRPQQHQFGHGRQLSDPAVSLGNNHHRISPQSSPPSHNPYLGSSGSNTPNSQSSPSNSNPYLASTAPPANPYISGSGPSSLTPGHIPGRPHPSALPLNNGTHLTTGSITSPVHGQGQHSYTNYSSAPQQPSGPPLLWRETVSGGPQQSNGSFSFPMPTVAGGRNPSYDSGDYRRQNLNGGYSHRPSTSRDEHDADTYLQSRYQTPLPLPPDAARPGPTPAATAARAPTPPRKDNTPAPDSGRLEALRRAEDAAARRREQELKDLELAMQLDRELNLEEERAMADAASR